MLYAMAFGGGYLSSEVAQFSFAIRVSRAAQKALSS